MKTLFIKITKPLWLILILFLVWYIFILLVVVLTRCGLSLSVFLAFHCTTIVSNWVKGTNFYVFFYAHFIVTFRFITNYNKRTVHSPLGTKCSSNTNLFCRFPYKLSKMRRYSTESRQREVMAASLIVPYESIKNYLVNKTISPSIISSSIN